MPALPADIESAIRPDGVTLAIAESAGVQATYPNARDGLEAPQRSFLDSTADAATLNTERFNLLSVPRRRFRVEAEGVLTALLPTGVTPAVTLVDSETAASGAFLVARIEFNLDDERTQIEVYG